MRSKNTKHWRQILETANNDIVVFIELIKILEITLVKLFTMRFICQNNLYNKEYYNIFNHFKKMLNFQKNTWLKVKLLVPPEFQVVLKPKVERCTKSDIIAFRVYIRFTLLIKKYRQFQMGFNDIILKKIGWIIIF